MGKCNKILKFFEYTEQNIIEMEYLISLIERFDIKEEVLESIFQFSPTFDENGRNETFPVFYKKIMLEEISFYLCIKFGETLYDDKVYIENYALSCQVEWLNNPLDNVYFDYLLKNNILEKSLSEIIEEFKEFIK
jgi:hypothetical protein